MDRINRIHTVFFSLLRSGLWSGSVDEESYFPLSGEEWQQIYDLAIEQTVEGLLFSAVERLNKEWLPPTELWMRWLVRVTKIEQRNQQMNRCLVEQLNCFKSLGIQPILLKGQGLAQHYKEPLRRVAGDVDWFFATDKQYKKANNWAEANGESIEYLPGRSMCYFYKGFEIDHHANLIDLHNPFVQPFLKRLIAEEEKNGRELLLEQTSCQLLSPVLNTVQVVSHVLKHLLAFGLGLRQLCDVARLYYAQASEIDGDYLRRVYKRLGIERWVVLLHDVLVRYLGLHPSMLPYIGEKEVNADWMMNDVLRAGNFGFFDKEYGGKDEWKSGARKNAFLRVSRNLWKYGPYAPMESAFFPLVQIYTGLIKK